MVLKFKIFQRFNYIIPAIKYVYQVYEDVDMFLFFAVMSYKFQPKLLSEILAMGNEVEVLPINDINKELNNLDDE